jgi:cytochrome P450
MTNPPVTDWANDFDTFDESYVRDPFSKWPEMRAACPVVKSERWGGTHLVVGYEAVIEGAANTTALTSTLGTSIANTSDDYSDPNRPKSIINSDPPDHAGPRRMMLPTMTARAVAKWEPVTRALCESLIDSFLAKGRTDAAVEYAQKIPATVIGRMLGVPDALQDTFIVWVRDILEHGVEYPQRRITAFAELGEFFAVEIADRIQNPTDDLISLLAHGKLENDAVLEPRVIIGNLVLLLVAGIDTTWSAIGSSLWYLAQHPEDQARLRNAATNNEPELWDTAIEELLRMFAPVSMSRVALQDTSVAGCPIPKGRRVTLSFPAANRDPAVFPDPDRVILDRAENRHVAFGAGIHRCAGSNLARLELRIALQTWIERVGPFALADPKSVTWAGGQVRGPRTIPVTFAPR